MLHTCTHLDDQKSTWRNYDALMSDAEVPPLVLRIEFPTTGPTDNRDLVRTVVGGGVEKSHARCRFNQEHTRAWSTHSNRPCTACSHIATATHRLSLRAITSPTCLPHQAKRGTAQRADQTRFSPCHTWGVGMCVACSECDLHRHVRSTSCLRHRGCLLSFSLQVSASSRPTRVATDNSSCEAHLFGRGGVEVQRPDQLWCHNA